MCCNGLYQFVIYHHYHISMKPFKIFSYIVIAASFAFSIQSCKPKKVLTKTPAPAETENKPVATPPPPPQPAPVKPQPVPAPVQPDFNFTNIQFDFDSHVLRTDAIQNLDHIVSQMKLDPSATFMLNGHASIEGTAAHNMVLSADRANSVKQYLTNSGIDASRLTTRGYGAKKPIASNKTEAGREKNRRVEVKLVH
jgi:outer membrane protein OmpA-like peptidoglycan-associated protein